MEKHGTGYLEIEITPPLQAVLDTCQDEIDSPFIIHKHPKSTRQSKEKEHKTQLSKEQISKGFKDAREASGIFKDMKPEEKPTFHEIRALGADLYEQSGVDPQPLLGHSNEQMTKKYLERHGVSWVETKAGLEL